MSSDRSRPTDDKAAEAARRDLERVRREGDTVLGSSLQAGAPQQTEADDPIEKLGKRIGRSLAYVALPIALFLFGRSAGWW
jgi:hypothetical protein